MKYLFLLSALFYSFVAQARIDVTFEPKSIKQGDSVELILSSETPFQGVPNLDILEKDFLIGGQQRKQSSEWINGHGSTTYQLIYTLFPNKSGDIPVKGLKIGSETLPEVTLKVQADAAYESTGKLSLSVDCPHKALYPSQKIFCQIVLDDTIGLVDGELIPPSSTVGTWEQLLPLAPTKQSTQSQGNYQSIFAFTPNQSGKIETDPFTFKGVVRMNTKPKSKAPNTLIDLMILGIPSTATKTVVTQSQPIVFNVKEKPATYQGWWLPSSQVTLSEQHDVPNPLHIGEPITRTITLFAQDIDAANLPVPTASQTTGFKMYANPEQRKNLPNGAELKVSLTFVPTQTGEITLPAISVPWFNTKTESIQTASVPAKDIFVTAEAVSASADQPTVSIPVTPTKGIQQDLSSSMQQDAQPVSTPTETIPWLLLIAAAGIAFVIGVLVAIILLKKNKNISKNNKKNSPLPDLYPF